MTDNKVVLEWMNGICEKAIEGKNNGDKSLMNRIASNAATRLYFDNVHGLHSVQENQFPAYYASQWKEITRLYEEYVRDETVSETVDKVAGLEARFDKLESMLTAFIESQQTPADEKPAKGKKKAEPVTEEADESAESEA